MMAVCSELAKLRTGIAMALPVLRAHAGGTCQNHGIAHLPAEEMENAKGQSTPR